MTEALAEAREMLAEITPLKKDCGQMCGARCCRSLPGEETGMLLFPGEESLYRDREGWRVLDTEQGMLVICPGTCRREERPLSCRIFPLLPILRGTEIKTATDLRARPVCPLAQIGKKALDPAFVAAVAEAGRRLAEDEEQAAFLRKLTEGQDALKKLREQFL